MLGKTIHRQFFKLFAFLMGADIDDPLGVPFQQLLHMGQNCMPVAGPCHNVGFLNFCRFLGKGLWVTTGQHGYGAGVFPFLAAKPFPAFLIAENL